MNTFSDWLVIALEDKKWTQADLAREAEVSPTAISDIISGRRNVGKNTAKAIAKAFKLPPEQVFRVAGLLPPNAKVDEYTEQIVHETQDLTRREKEEVLAYIRMRKNLRKE